MKLNHQQETAVKHYHSPQVIIAGAGTGKTTVMIEKIKYLISSGKHHANKILALTFTNKAANEMKERFAKFSSNDTPPFFGTFHSFCLQFLKASKHIHNVGIKQDFTIIDFQQQKEIINKLIKSNNITIGRSPKETISKISSIKQFPQTEHALLLSDAADDIQTLFTPYNNQLKQLNCVDFDDLLLHTYSILNIVPEALQRTQTKYEYLIIDEYQDTNKIQNDLCILLAQEHQNICVVGDFDQTIYSWRGAKIENLLEFTNYFPGTTTHKLEINYRSTSEILTAANQLIEHNLNRQPKKLSTDRKSGSKVQHIICFDEREEAQTIAKKINQLQKDSDYSLNDFAILYRTNQQSRTLEEVLTHYNLPHHIVGTTPFYQRKEIKHCIAFLQCLYNINQPIWFEHALLNPARGVGKRTVEKLLQFSIEEKLDIVTAIKQKECPLSSRFISSIQTFIDMMETLNVSSQPISKTLEEILNQLDFENYLKKLDNYNDRINNVKELISKLEGVANLEEFLNEITLFQNTDTESDKGKISCLTLHLAKGLEFPVVFIPGFENDLLPLRNTESKEEERRLSYVGITRGKDQVFLLSTYKRMLMGEDRYHNISEFTKELQGTVNISVTEQTHQLGKAMLFKLNDARLDYKIIESEKKPIEKKAVGAKQIISVFDIGDIVYHPTLGTGTIQGTSGKNDSLMYTVNFSSGKKTLMAKFAPLKYAQ